MLLFNTFCYASIWYILITFLFKKTNLMEVKGVKRELSYNLHYDMIGSFNNKII